MPVAGVGDEDAGRLESGGDEDRNAVTGDLVHRLERRNKPKRPGWNGGAYDLMRSVLSTDRIPALYKQRAQLIELTFRGAAVAPRRCPTPPHKDLCASLA